MENIFNKLPSKSSKNNKITIIFSAHVSQVVKLSPFYLELFIKWAIPNLFFFFVFSTINTKYMFFIKLPMADSNVGPQELKAKPTVPQPYAPWFKILGWLDLLLPVHLRFKITTHINKKAHFKSLCCSYPTESAEPSNKVKSISCFSIPPGLLITFQWAILGLFSVNFGSLQTNNSNFVRN